MNYKSIIKAGAVTAVAAVSFSSGAFAQTHMADTTFAYVPFRVNVDARITAAQGEDTVSMDVEGRTEGADTLKLPIEISITDAVRHAVRTQGRMNAPTITGSRGNITLRLPTQSYRNAEVALHSVNGKRIMRGKADASQTSSGMSRRNVAAGVYMLSAKGMDGNAFTARLTHGGGKMNINVAFGAESALRSPARQLGKKADVEDGDWEITVSAAAPDTYRDSVYVFNPAAWDSLPQVITLVDTTTPPPPEITTFVDERDGTIYKKVTIGTQTWMAQNLNYNVPDSTQDVCYSNQTSNCVKYGRLYNWAMAMGIDTSCNNTQRCYDERDVNRQGVCPAGWHLPSNAEWTQLTDFVGGESTAGTKLKSQSGWDWNGSKGGTDEYGFSALPGGFVSAGGSVYDVDITGCWWSATWFGMRNAYYRSMRYDYEDVPMSNLARGSKCSVRCVQDVQDVED